MPTRISVLALSLLLALVLGSVFMLQLSPPIGLASPTWLFFKEMQASLAIFVILALAYAPLASSLSNRMNRVTRISKRSLRLPFAARCLAAISLCVGLFGFVFWSTADVLGGYNGYQWSFAEHPYLQQIFNATDLHYMGSLDVGTQASIFFAIAIASFIALRFGAGLGAAVKDSITLFAAPLLSFFELALWYSAPNDMTWHVIDALWVGGTNDLGYRALDLPGSGPFFFSNWFVFMVCILLVASRIPFVSLPSRLLYSRRLVSPGKAHSPLQRPVPDETTRNRRFTRTNVTRHKRKP